MSTQAKESAPEAVQDPAAPAKPAARKKKGAASKAKPASAENKKKKKKGKGPGKYSQLVIDAIRTLGERNGSSLFKIYNEAKKVSWFDQQHGRVYLRYSIRALLQNDTLVQVKGLGANGSFKLNKKKFTSRTKRSSAKPGQTAKAARKPAKKAAEKKEKKMEKKKRISSSVKEETAPDKKSPAAKKAKKSPAVAAKKASKPKKAKQTKKTVKKA